MTSQPEGHSGPEIAPYVERPEQIAQGDIFKDVPFHNRVGGNLETWVMPGLVTSHSCDATKFFELRATTPTGPVVESWPVTMAPIHDPALLIGGNARHAAAGRMKRYFPLPDLPDHPPMVADLYLEQPIPAVLLLGLERVASLSDDYQTRLGVHIVALRTRRDLRDWLL